MERSEEKKEYLEIINYLRKNKYIQNLYFNDSDNMFFNENLSEVKVIDELVNINTRDDLKLFDIYGIKLLWIPTQKDIIIMFELFFKKYRIANRDLFFIMSMCDFCIDLKKCKVNIENRTILLLEVLLRFMSYLTSEGDDLESKGLIKKL